MTKHRIQNGHNSTHHYTVSTSKIASIVYDVRAQFCNCMANYDDAVSVLYKNEVLK